MNWQASNQRSQDTFTTSRGGWQPNPRNKNPYRWSRFDSKQDEPNVGHSVTLSFSNPPCEPQALYQKYQAISSRKGWTDSDRGEDLPLKDSRGDYHSSEDHRYQASNLARNRQQINQRYKIPSAVLSGERFYDGQQQTYTDSMHHRGHSDQRKQETLSKRHDMKHSTRRYYEPLADAVRDWNRPDQEYQEPIKDVRWDHEEQRYQSPSSDWPRRLHAVERCPHPSDESRKEWLHSNKKYPQPWSNDRENWPYSEKRYQEPLAEFQRDWRLSDQKYQGTSLSYNRDGQHSGQSCHNSLTGDRKDRVYSDERFEEPWGESRRDYQHSEQEYHELSMDYRNDRQRSEQRYPDPFVNSPLVLQRPERRFEEPLDYRRDRQSTEQRYADPFVNSPLDLQRPERRFEEPLDYRHDRQSTEQRYADSFVNSPLDLQHPERRFEEPLDYRHDRQSTEQRYADSFVNSPLDLQCPERRFEEPLDYRRDRQSTEQRYADSFDNSPLDLQRPERRFEEPLDYRRDRQSTEQRYADSFVNSPLDLQRPERRFQEPLPHIRGRYPNNFRTSDGLNPSQDYYKPSFQAEESWEDLSVADNRKRPYGEDIDGTRAIYELPNKRSRIDYQPIRNNSFLSSSAGFVNPRSGYNHFHQKRFTRKQYIKMEQNITKNLKEQNPRKYVKPMVENAPRYTVLFQYLWDLKQPLEDSHIEFIKKHIELLHEEDKMKKPTRKWQPVFLEFAPRENGLAVVCENQNSFDWLIKRRIPPVDDKIIISCNALTPVKNVKLNCCIKNCTDSPEDVLSKFDKSNRGLSFRQFRVLEHKEQDGSVLMTVLTDSRTVAKMKKINYLVRYGQGNLRKVKFFKCKKSNDGEDNSEDLDGSDTEKAEGDTAKEEGDAESKTPSPKIGVAENSK